MVLDLQSSQKNRIPKTVTVSKNNPDFNTIH
ncbi:MAG: hypothetical protein ACD_34C00101G0001, partial [uncultured bacterium]